MIGRVRRTADVLEAMKAAVRTPGEAGAHRPPRSQGRFSNKVALVNRRWQRDGSSNGGGARRAGRRGRDHRPQWRGAEATARKIRDSGGSALAFKGDVAHLETQREIVSKIVDQLGALHFAVNNAGISGQFGALPDVPVEDWERVVNVNLNAIYFE